MSIHYIRKKLLGMHNKLTETFDHRLYKSSLMLILQGDVYSLICILIKYNFLFTDQTGQTNFHSCTCIYIIIQCRNFSRNYIFSEMINSILVQITFREFAHCSGDRLLINTNAVHWDERTKHYITTKHYILINIQIGCVSNY